MKTIKLAFLSILFAITMASEAQVSVNVNIGTPPVWAPSNAVAVQYYYLPEIETYYDVPSKKYIYFSNGKWVRVGSLPPHYRHYDLYHGHTVFLTDYKGKYPYNHFKQHKVKYPKGKNYKHSNGNGNGHGNGNGNGKGNGKGKK